MPWRIHPVLHDLLGRALTPSDVLSGAHKTRFNRDKPVEDRFPFGGIVIEIVPQIHIFGVLERRLVESHTEAQGVEASSFAFRVGDVANFLDLSVERQILGSFGVG